MRSPDIVVRIDRKGLVVVAALVLIGGTAGLLWSETLTMTTYYPSPVGVYNKLTTTGNSGGVPANTTLNRDAGNTILAPATNAGGRVGIGTAAPTAKLDVAGAVKVGSYATGSAPAGGDGAIYYNSTENKFKGRQAGAWVNLGGGEKDTASCAWRTITYTYHCFAHSCNCSTAAGETFTCPSGQFMNGYQLSPGANCTSLMINCCAMQ